MKRKKVKSKHSYMYSPGMIQCAVDIATGDDGSCSKKVLEIIKNLNIKPAPPDGWKPEDKVQAPSVKQLRLTSDKLIRYYKRHRDVN